MRLDKYLSDMCVGTRSEIKKAVRTGRVLVDGIVARDPGMRIDVLPEDREDAAPAAVVYCGTPVGYNEFEYYMMNKPAGVISATDDPRHTTVIDLITGIHRRDLFPVGRLDIDTEGLLLITNDGQLAHRLLSPKKHVDKRYYARVEGRLDEDDIAAFREGIELEDLTCLPAGLSIISSGDISEAVVVIQEGKFHQVKRMFASRGKTVIYLKRLSMGSLELDDSLAPGEYRTLTGEELAALRAVYSQ